MNSKTSLKSNKIWFLEIFVWKSLGFLWKMDNSGILFTYCRSKVLLHHVHNSSIIVIININWSKVLLYSLYMVLSGLFTSSEYLLNPIRYPKTFCIYPSSRRYFFVFFFNLLKKCLPLLVFSVLIRDPEIFRMTGHFDIWMMALKIIILTPKKHLFISVFFCFMTSSTNNTQIEGLSRVFCFFPMSDILKHR